MGRSRCGTPARPLARTPAGLKHAQCDQRVSLIPTNASNGAAGLRNRLSTPGPFVTPLGGIPGPLIPVGSLRMPHVAYLRFSRLLTEANISKCGVGLIEVWKFNTV
jgi:hypothetical protein